MELGVADASGRPRPVPVPGSEFRVDAGAVIAAISQQPDWSALEALDPGQDGAPGDHTIPAGLDGVWYGGDVEGLGIASRAVARGRLAAEAAHARLRRLPDPELPTDPPLALDGQRADFFPDTLPAKRPLLLPDVALADPTAEVVGGLNDTQFLLEADRCFSCGLCFGCHHCTMFCSAGAFTPVKAPEHGAYFALDLEVCESCGKCVDVCPCGFLEFGANGGPPA